MLALAIVLPLLIANVFASSLDQAFALAQNKDWNGAAGALDRAFTEDPASFAANNLHYLRGRIAENQNDWKRALAEFQDIDSANALRPLATLHAALASIHLQDAQQADTLIAALPADFPASMKVQLAREAPPEIAVKIYGGLTSREARFQHARLQGGQTAALWSLLHESNSDDVALQSARLLAPGVATPREIMDVAGAFAAHRQFGEAIVLYNRAAEDPQFSAEAAFQIGRAHFQKQNYAAAIDQYQLVVSKFDGSDWQKEAEYQIANSYWRLGEYRKAEKAYLDYLTGRSVGGMQESAIRNLVDVYRALGENTKALALLDKTLAKRVSSPTRQSLLFTKAKILYTEKRYAAALQIFRQLERSRLQSTPGGASADEVQYFEAITLAGSGNKAAANAIWRKLAAEPLSYYGQKSAGRLGSPFQLAPAAEKCAATADPSITIATQRVTAMRHPVRSETDSASDAVSELVFLQLWDEASQWIERTRRPNPRLAADLAYLAGRYEHAIQHAAKLPGSEETRDLEYPAAFRPIICSAAAAAHVDPLWLHAIIWQESKYNPNAASGASARGLMQFITDTASTVGASIGMPAVTIDQLYDPTTSIRLGAHYWASLMDEFKQPELALAAYNGGPENVRRWRDKWPGADIEFFVSDIGFVETKRYVQAVFAARAAYGRRD
jgi:soluble lytic murein transglycosylase-like protein/TolA-binding protein